MNVQVIVDACNSHITFQEPEIGLEFIKMVLNGIKPSQFLQFVQAVATRPDAMTQAAELVTRCMGVPS